MSARWMPGNSNSSPKKTQLLSIVLIAITVFMLFAMTSLATPAMANADELSITAAKRQSDDANFNASVQSADNTVKARATELQLGIRSIGELDYKKDTTTVETHYYKFKTSQRRSTYRVQLDSWDGSTFWARVYNEAGNQVGWPHFSYAYTFARSETSDTLIGDKSDCAKNSWYYIEIEGSTRYSQYGITVTEFPTIGANNVTIANSIYEYTGSEIQPTPSVMVNGKALVKDIDFDVEYSNNIDAGTAEMTISGIGGYIGTVSKEFTIAPRQIVPTLKLSQNKFYHGEMIWYSQPSVSVYGWNNELLPTRSYSVSYPDSGQGIGAHRVIVKLEGNYSGTATAFYRIYPASISINGFSRAKKGFKVAWNTQSGIDGYQIKYASKKGFKRCVKTINIKNSYKSTKIIKKLKSKKKYFVKIRTYKKVNGQKYYSKWSKTRSVRTK